MTIKERKRERIIELWEKGLKLKEISILTGISESTCRKIVKEIDDYDEEIEENDMDIEEEIKTKKAKKSGWDLDIIDEKTQLKYELNQLASQTGRDLNEFLSDINDIFSEWSRYSDNPIEEFDYFYYLAILLKKLKTEDEGVIFDFLKNAIKEDKDLEEFKEKKEYLNELITEEIEDHETKLAKIKAEIENSINIAKNAKVAYHIETQRFLKGNPKLPELEAENKEMKEKIKDVIKKTDAVVKETQALNNENQALKETLVNLENYLINNTPEGKAYLEQFKTKILGELEIEKL